MSDRLNRSRLPHRLGEEIQTVLDEKTNPWGITTEAVEIRDIIIPKGLEDAMSRQAQAERERQSRIILGTAETEILRPPPAYDRSHPHTPRVDRWLGRSAVDFHHVSLLEDVPAADRLPVMRAWPPEASVLQLFGYLLVDLHRKIAHRRAPP